MGNGKIVLRVGNRCVLALVAAWLLQGCSFLFVDTPPTVHGDEPPAMRSVQCTSSVAAPVVDTVIAAFEAVRTGFALGANDADYHNYPISRGADIAIGLGLTGLFAAAAGYGYVNTSKCSDLKDEAREPPPPGWVPPPPRMPPPSIQAMCSYDAQCKGDRICEGGRCVSPPQPSTPPPDTPSPAEPPPAAPEPAPSTPPPSVAPTPSPGGGPI